MVSTDLVHRPPLLLPLPTWHYRPLLSDPPQAPLLPPAPVCFNHFLPQGQKYLLNDHPWLFSLVNLHLRQCASNNLSQLIWLLIHHFSQWSDILLFSLMTTQISFVPQEVTLNTHFLSSLAGCKSRAIYLRGCLVSFWYRSIISCQQVGKA